MNKFTSLVIGLFLCLITINSSHAQEQPSCQMEGNPTYMRVMINPDSYLFQREQFVKQFSEAQLIKATSIEYLNGKFELKIPSDPSLKDLDKGDSFGGVTRHVPIVAHVVRRDNESGGLSLSDLNQSIARANTTFQQVSMTFDLAEVRYIDDTKLYDYYHSGAKETESNTKLQVRTRNVPRMLNIYFVPNSSTSWSNWPAKSADKQHILIKNSHARNESTLAHEIGHWFNLYHTHEPALGKELVDGSNCTTAGDLLCDTPADPNVSGKVDNDTDCNYTGTATDANGDTYDPDPTNVMSYSYKKCRTNFSDDQVARIHSYYLGMKNDRGYTFALSPGDGILVYRPKQNTSGEWYFDFNLDKKTDKKINAWGLKGDLPLSGDFNGNGQVDIAVYRPSTSRWYFDFGANGVTDKKVGPWGFSEDLPISGDFNNDGKTDFGVFRPSKGEWYLNYNLDGTTDKKIQRKWGLPGDLPIAGDFNGDGKSDIGVFRPSTGWWYFDYNLDGITDKKFGAWGLQGDLPFAYDLNGDGKLGIAVYRPSTKTWYFDDNLDGRTDKKHVNWGINGDRPFGISLK